ncbi:MAG: glycerol kinase GlpK [Gemmatimonadota bacterium]
MTSILALDQGTTGSTALVIHQDGTILGRGYREIPQHFPAPGQVEHDPEDLYQATLAAAREAIAASGAQPAGIGITNQRETVVLWDRQTLQPVHRAIVWQDRRTTDRCRALQQEGREDWVRERTGLMLDPYFSATKLEWLLRDPDLRRRAERGELAAGTVDSWLIARLSGGVHVTDRTNASRTMLYALDDGAWDPELCTLFHIPPGLLPELGPSSGVVAETGVFGRDIPVAGVAGDQQAALFGQGCVTPGSAKSTYGTGAFLLLQAGPHRPAASPGLLTTIACGPRGEPTFALEGSVFIAGAAIQWLRDGLGLIISAAESEALARSVPDSGGVTFVPAFVGLGSPHWQPDARGTITGLTRGTTRAHLVRAALEAMAFGTGELLEAMLNGTGHRATALRVDGGAAANDWLMQFQADLLGIPVERPAVVETTALGAGLLAGLAVGVWPSVEGFLDRLPWQRFTPTMGQPERDLLRGGWQRAVNAALAWAQAAP